MHWWQSLILGIVEGLTEYLPVSSTGHLILTQRAMGISEGTAADAFAIIIQFGAIIAVFGLYWRRIKQMLRGLLGKDRQGLHLAINLVVAFMPAAVIGLLLHKKITQYLFGLWPITAAWFVGGLAILAVAYWRKKRKQTEGMGETIDQLTWPMALVIGLAQCLAMWPGTSRSLVTILAGILVGMSLVAAVEFSFLLGLITLTAASVFELRHGGAQMFHAFGWANVAIGIIAAAIAAAIAVEWMVTYLKRHSLAIFGYYRILLALVVIVLILSGVLNARTSSSTPAQSKNQVAAGLSPSNNHAATPSDEPRR